MSNFATYIQVEGVEIRNLRIVEAGEEVGREHVAQEHAARRGYAVQALNRA